MKRLEHLETARLTLRPITRDDAPALAIMNADADVMRYFPAPLTGAQSDAFVDRLMAHQVEHGFSLMLAAHKKDAALVGLVGLLTADFAAPFTPAIEIGWRLNAAYWGQGLAPEAARAVLRWAFEVRNLPEIVSFTARANLASQRVMQKIGLSTSASEDFIHPKLPQHNPLAPHVLYRLTAPAWRRTHQPDTGVSDE